ncbi:MAG: ABC transporter permease [Oscillospiraceae bacterium]|nr:ABC transporter permease [Oscillospiraceae bacterium]
MKSITALLSALPGSVAQGLIWGVLAIGVYITYKVLDFADLTVDGSLGTGGAVAVMLITNGCPIPLALVVAFIAGCAAGFITGILNTMLGIPAILSGILTQLALYSINLDIMGKANAAVSVDKYDLLVSLRYIPQSIITGTIFIVAIALALYWFFGTEQGFTLRATGCNPNMARAQGINTKKSTVIGLVLGNGLVGLAGGLLAQYQGYSDVNMGRGAIVIGLAAIIIGEVLGELILGKRLNFIGRLLFTAVGAIIYFVVIQVVLWLGLSSQNTKLFSAITVAVFLAVPYLKAQSKTSFKRAAKRGVAEDAGA